MKNFKLDEQHKIATGFSVPDGYFESFPGRVENLIREDSVQVMSLPARNNLGWMLKAAAVLLLALVLPLLHQIKTSSSVPEPELSSMETYFSLHPEIGSEQIAEHLDVTDLNNIKINYHLEDDAIEDVLATNPDVEQYLIY